MSKEFIIKSEYKKTGFTLTELLAVIVILAVIALIATPIILNVIENSKEGAFKDSVHGIIQVAEQDYAQKLINEEDVELPFTYKLSEDKLTYKGTIFTEGKIIIDETGKIMVQNLCNSEYCATGNQENLNISSSAKKQILFKEIFEGNVIRYGVDYNDKLYMWGVIPDMETQLFYLQDKPTPFFHEKTVKDFAIGNRTAILLTTDNEVYTWGESEQGQIGNGTISENFVVTPIKLTFPETITKVVAGYSTIFVITEAGEVYGWGKNNYGQIGDGVTTATQTKPKKATALAGLNIVDIVPSTTNTLAFTNDGELYGWGRNGYNSIDQTGIASKTPIKIESPTESKIVDYTALIRNTLVLLEDGSVYIWGDNAYGQYGNGTTKSQNGPIYKVPIEEKIVRIESTTAAYTVFAVTENNQIYSWGGNSSGSLKVGFTSFKIPPDNVKTPTIIMNGKTFEEIVVGYASTIVRGTDKKYYAWGFLYEKQEDGSATFPDEIMSFDYFELNE